VWLWVVLAAVVGLAVYCAGQFFGLFGVVAVGFFVIDWVMGACSRIWLLLV
jgi:hypothetical protein